MNTNMKKSFVVPLMILLAIMVIGVAFYLASKSQADRKASPEVSSDWKEYSGQGFKFKYPPNAQLTEKKDAIIVDISAYDDVQTIHSSKVEIASSAGACSAKNSNYPNGIRADASKNITLADDKILTYLSTGDAGAGQRQEVEIYQLDDNGICNQAALTIDYSDPGLYADTSDDLYKLTGDSISAIKGAFKQIASTIQITSSDEETYKNSKYGFSLRYPGGVFTLVSFGVNLPSNPAKLYDAQKLISTVRAKNLGKPGCMYGESGIATTCNAAHEEGIEIVPVTDSVANLTRSLDPSLKDTVTVAGRTSVKFSIGAEGAGNDYYYIPLKPDQTLVLIRKYEYKGFLDPAAFNSVLGTLIINN